MAALALAMGVILFLLPPTTTQERDVVYQHGGTFSYDGKVSGQGLPDYGRSLIQTGDPVYLELTGQIRIGFDYAFETRGALDVSGTAGLVAEISDINGWRRTTELASPTPFEGGAVTVTGQLDLNALRAMTTELESLTGVQRDHYTVAIRPEISLEGTLAGRPLSEHFAPELRFFLDPLQLQLEPAGAAPPGEEVVDPLHPAFGGLLKTEVEVPRTFSLFGAELGLVPIRAATVVVLVLVSADCLRFSWVAHARPAGERPPSSSRATGSGSSRSRTGSYRRADGRCRSNASTAWFGSPPTTATSSCTRRGRGSTPTPSRRMA